MCKTFHKFGNYLVTAFLDDLLLIGATVHRTALVTSAVVDLFKRLALLYHEEKCNLEPKTEIEHLGFRLIVNKQQYMLSAKQIKKLLSKVTSVIALARANKR